MEFFDAITGLFLQFIDLVLHLDKHLAVLVQQYGPWIYAILFFIVFSETGFVVLPFLPGDSLLFVAGALAAIGDMALMPLMLSLSLAAVLGNSLNYAIGRWFGHRILAWEHPLARRIINRAALAKTHAFFEAHGGKTLVISHFLPLLRTFAPFVAGMGEMGYGRFTFFNLVGGFSWVVSLSLAGYWFGNLPVIKNNLSAVVVGIIVVSLLPAIIGFLKARKADSQ